MVHPRIGFHIGLVYQHSTVVGSQSRLVNVLYDVSHELIGGRVALQGTGHLLTKKKIQGAYAGRTPFVGSAGVESLRRSND